ncbi:MAG: Rrf2 family transcriptional regulator [Desulfobacteraceae bacterium]|nr:Rrf2 family transcriptional regulator [Desulfobacteraceae bacterium]
MFFSQRKTQYALRAIYELAKRHGEGPTKISEIAKVQGIPTRFLEVILNQLKASGMVESKRGFYGGYRLIRQPGDITIGDVLRYMQKSAGHSACIACVAEESCPFDGNCVFSDMWKRVHTEVYKIFDGTTIEDLVHHGSS